MQTQAFVDELARRLRDVSKRQWKETILVDALNAAMRSLCSVMPQAYTVHRTIPLIQGSEQRLPAELHRIVQLLHNVDPHSGDVRRAITLADKSVLDAAYPHWRQDATRGYVRHYMTDTLNDDTFYVWPPAGLVGDERPPEPVEPLLPAVELEGRLRFVNNDFQIEPAQGQGGPVMSTEAEFGQFFGKVGTLFVLDMVTTPSSYGELIPINGEDRQIWIMGGAASSLILSGRWVACVRQTYNLAKNNPIVVELIEQEDVFDVTTPGALAPIEVVNAPTVSSGTTLQLDSDYNEQIRNTLYVRITEDPQSGRAPTFPTFAQPGGTTRGSYTKRLPQYRENTVDSGALMTRAVGDDVYMMIGRGTSRSNGAAHTQSGWQPREDTMVDQPLVLRDLRALHDADYQIALAQYEADLAFYESTTEPTVIQVRGQFTAVPVIDDTPAPGLPPEPVGPGATQAEIDAYLAELAIYNEAVAELAAFNARDVTTIQDPLPVHPIYIEPLFEYALYYCYAVDDEGTPNTARANRHWQAFFQLLNKQEDTAVLVESNREVVE